jgi:hypothetical protein
MNDKLDEQEKKLIEELTTIPELEYDEKLKIYEEIKKEKRQKTKKQLLKDFGDTPMFYIILFSSISLTILSIFAIRYLDFINRKSIFVYVEPLYTFEVVLLSCVFFMLYLFIFVMSISLHDKSELSKKDNKP